MVRFARLAGTALAILTLVTACADDRPPNLSGDGTGGGGTSGTGPDAAPTADAAGTGTLQVSGVVCIIDDLRTPTSCSNADAVNLTVTERGTENSVTAASDGTYSITLNAASAPHTLVVRGPGYRTSVVPIAPQSPTSDALVPVMTDTAYAAQLTSLSLSLPATAATVAAYMFENDAPVSGARVIAPSGVQPYYDIAAPPGFNRLGPTGDAGVAIMFGMPTAEPTASFQATNASTTVSLTVSPVPVTAGAITFVWIDISP